MNEMASQVIGGAVSQLQVLEIYSCLRGYHAYMEIWTPVMGVVKIEPTNRHDTHSVAIYRDAEIVGHVPYNLAPRMSAFFMRENKVFAGITGANVNREARYGLEVPCVNHIYGPNVYVDKMKAFIEFLLADDGHYNLCNSDSAKLFLINGCGQWSF